jgi:hypothetical protein
MPSMQWKNKEMHEFVLKAIKESNVNQRKALILHGSGEVPKNK